LSNPPVGVAVDAAGKIYIAEADRVVTYTANGTKTDPSIDTGPATNTGIAVAAGKIYVSAVYEGDGGELQTYTASGLPSIPTMDLGVASSVAVDASGKIYITNSRFSSVTAYTQNGESIVPTISAGVHLPIGVTVDAAGKIYVANSLGGSLTTYTAAGGQTAPTITGLYGPVGVAVH
jgi:serine/threonine-protein kinase